MPNLTEVLQEMQSCNSSRPIDTIRHKYIDDFARERGRNVIVYYSGWLQKIQSEHSYLVSITDNDMNFFMSAIHSLDKKLGLDLILHTPGGDMAATDSIVNYLHSKFEDIECFIPQLAMSAGTSIACACNKIHMGKQSSIGPIDPQLGTIPCYGVIDEYEYVKDKVLGNLKKGIPRDLDSVHFWREFIVKYHPSFINECYQVITMAKECLMDWLKKRKSKGFSSQYIIL